MGPESRQATRGHSTDWRLRGGDGARVAGVDGCRTAARPQGPPCSGHTCGRQRGTSEGAERWTKFAAVKTAWALQADTPVSQLLVLLLPSRATLGSRPLLRLSFLICKIGQQLYQPCTIVENIKFEHNTKHVVAIPDTSKLSMISSSYSNCVYLLLSWLLSSPSHRFCHLFLSILQQ